MYNNDLFDQILFGSRSDSKTTSFKSPVDGYTTIDGATFEFALVGANKEDITVSTASDTISVKYTKSDVDEVTPERVYFARGISRKNFSYGWKISRKFDLSKLEINFTDGLLTIFIPTAENAKEKEWKF